MTKNLKETAIDCLKYLGVYEDGITDFIENDRVWLSDSSSPAYQLVLTSVDEELQKQIDKLQEETGGLIYHVIRNVYDSVARYTGIVDTFLIAMPGSPLFTDGTMSIRNGVVSALTVNEDTPDRFYSSLVYVEPKHGGLNRSNSTFDYESFNRKKADTAAL